VVGFAPAGGNDIIARLMGQWLSERTASRSSSKTSRGGDQHRDRDRRQRHPRRLHDPAGRRVGRHQCDPLRQSLLHFLRDIAPAAGIMGIPLFVATNPSVPASHAARVHRLRQSQVRQDQHGVGGHRQRRPSRRRAVQHDGPAFTWFMCPIAATGRPWPPCWAAKWRSCSPTPPSSIEFIRPASLRGLATTGAARSEALPDMPMVAEFVPGYETSAWYGVGVPKATPAEIVDRIHRQVAAGLVDARMKARFADLGGGADADDAGRVHQAHRRRDRQVGQGDPPGQPQAGVKQYGVPRWRPKRGRSGKAARRTCRASLQAQRPLKLF